MCCCFSELATLMGDPSQRNSYLGGMSEFSELDLSREIFDDGWPRLTCMADLKKPSMH